MELLQYWLLVMAFLRSISVVSGFLPSGSSTFQQFLYSKAKGDMTPLAARLMAVWTVLTCAACIWCSLNIHDRGLYELTMFTMLVAFVFFVFEFFVHKTVPKKIMFTTGGVAGLSFVWMMLRYEDLVGRK